MGNLAASRASLRISELRERFERDGFAVVPSCLDNETVERVCTNLDHASHGRRTLLALSVVRELAASAPVRKLAEPVLGRSCFAMKGTFFNKTQESNWKVAWHQDLTIIVQKRLEAPGFGPWTVKAGIVHVQP